MKPIIIGLVVLGAVVMTTTTLTVTTVKWNAPKVRISLIRLASSSPRTYEQIRVLATSTPNLGVFKWSKLPVDKGTERYISVECIFSEQECHSALIGPYTVK